MASPAEYREQAKSKPPAEVVDLTGKVCLVTGASSGIGKATALKLAGLGATVVLVCRDRTRGETAAEEIRRLTGNESIGLLVGDLSEQRDIRRIVREFNGRYTALHLLINNAGAVYPDMQISGDGIEKTFALNQMAYFLLTTLLIDLLRRSAPARILNITSATYRYVKTDLNDIVKPRRYKPFRAYAMSKLANILFTSELKLRLDGTGITTACVHPGGVRTSIYNSTIQGRIFTRLFGWTLGRPERSAAAITDVATDKQGIASGELYYELDRPTTPAPHAIDRAGARAMWDFCEGLVRTER
jgi:NAD(P)-dependent dehydrogenase (short-subunit alcohol dehydrogenase family)